MQDKMSKGGQFFITALKGFAMGAANVVPGVSGGTIALITNIYEKLVGCIAAFSEVQTWKALFHGHFKEFWQKIDGTFLLALGIGLVLSILSLASAVTWLLAHYPILTWAFFFGLIVASSILMFVDIKGWNWKSVAFAVAGLVLGVVVCTMSPVRTPDDGWFIFICGAIAICTMILPGISGSFVLLIMCKYEYIMQALSDMNIPVLAVFAAGCVVGILAFAKLLKWLLARWKDQTMLVLLGFVIGSLVRVWPWSDTDAITEAQVLRTGVEGAPLDFQIPWAVLCCLAGIVLVLAIEFAGRRKSF